MEQVGLSRAEAAGILEMRRLLAALRKDGYEHGQFVWVWQGRKLHRVRLIDYSKLVNVE